MTLSPLFNAAMVRRRPRPVLELDQKDKECGYEADTDEVPVITHTRGAILLLVGDRFCSTFADQFPFMCIQFADDVNIPS